MDNSIHPPPRLLLGASLLFWGAITGNAFLGLAVALLIESANWIRLRWDFDDSACMRAWRVCMVLFLISGSLLWLDGDSTARYTVLPKLMIWLPLLLLPLQFVQSFGMRDRMALNNFSAFSKQRRERNLRLGLRASVIHFNFGNLYFLATITAASLGTNAQGRVFFPGLVLLGGWLVYSKLKIRPLAFSIIVGIAGMIGIGGQMGLERLYDWANDLTRAGGYPGTDTTVNRTAIGSLGKIKQSPEMLWRLQTIGKSHPPQLLRLASYNLYRGVVWKNEVPEQFKDEPPFQDLTNIELTEGEPYYFFPREDKAPPDLRKPLPSFRIRGASKSSEPLPLPGNAETLQEFDLDAIEFNRLGTVRVFPKKSIIGGIVRWKDANEIESPPSQEIDLGVPELEEEIIEETVEMLGLRDLPTANAKIARIHQWFGQEFTYTRYLDISPVLNTRPSAIGIFLTTSKRGHCEYFATAATLLLRAAGVPARYCVGFSVMEKDFKRNEYIIRGTHGHAWCRVWDGERWIDFDATPSGWLALETGGETQSRWLADTYQRLKEDFFLWRNRPTNRTGATIVMWLIGLSVLTFVARRLWKSKVQLQAKAANPFAETPAPRTPLHNLESPALRILGPRPAGMTFSNWLVRLSEKNISTPEMDEAIALHQRMRFDPEGVPNEAEARLGVLTKDLEKLLKQNKLSAR